MKRTNRILFCLMIICFAMTILPGLVAAKEKVFSSIHWLDNAYFVIWDKAGKQAAEDIGLDYVGITHEMKPQKQIADVQSMINEGVKMLYCTLAEPSTIKPIVRYAQDNKAYCVIVAETVPWFTPLDVGDYYLAFHTHDTVLEAERLATLLFKAMGGKGTFLHMEGWPGAIANLTRTIGVDEAMKQFPEIKRLDKKFGKWNRVDAQKVMEDMIITYPQFDAVYANNDDMMVGIVGALSASGITGKKLVSIDANEENCHLIKTGEQLASLAIWPTWRAGWIVSQLYDAAHGFKYSVPERMTAGATSIITKENVDGFVKMNYAAKRYDFDYKKMSRVLHPKDWDPQAEVYALDPVQFFSYQMQSPNKPAGYELPAAYQKAIKEGQLKKVTDMYSDHYKMKMEDKMKKHGGK